MQTMKRRMRDFAVEFNLDQVFLFALKNSGRCDDGCAHNSTIREYLEYKGLTVWTGWLYIANECEIFDQYELTPKGKMLLALNLEMSAAAVIAFDSVYEQLADLPPKVNPFMVVQSIFSPIWTTPELETDSYERKVARAARLGADMGVYLTFDEIMALDELTDPSHNKMVPQTPVTLVVPANLPN
ncbi:MAG: hypothetical protein ABI947_00995 [Chloroflexota bacterium]